MVHALLLSAALFAQTPAPATATAPAATPAAEAKQTASTWRPPLTATLGLANQIATHRSYDFVDDNDAMPMVRVAAGYAFRVDKALLDVELGFQSGGSSATVHGVTDASVWLRGLDLGATYRYPLLRFLHPYARLAAGYDWATLEVGDVLQRVGQPSITAMGGIAVPVVQLERDGEKHPLFMLDFGVGYTLRPSFTFDALQPESPERPDPNAVPIAPLNLGRMELSGIAWRLALTFRL